jgi:hypothetical protein
MWKTIAAGEPWPGASNRPAALQDSDSICIDATYNEGCVGRPFFISLPFIG